MSDSPEGQGHSGAPVVATSDRWVAVAALLVAVVAIALAAWSLVSGSSDNTSAAPGAGDPKTRVCTAFDMVSKAVPLQMNNALGSGPVAKEAVAVNARLSLIAGGQYLLNNLDPATPAELANYVRILAHHLQDFGMNAMAGARTSEIDQTALIADTEQGRKQIAELCK